MVSAHRTNLRKINSQQKHALKLVHNKNRFYHSKELFEFKILNVYKLNLFNTAVFMYKVKNRTAPSLFLEKFEQISHSHLIRFSSGNYWKPQIKLRKCRSSNMEWPTQKYGKRNSISSLFKTKIKSKLFNFKNEVTFF